MIEIKKLQKLLEHREGVLYWIAPPSPSQKYKVGQRAGGGASVNKDGYLTLVIQRRRYLAHQVVFALVYGYWADEIDHRDRVRTNNCPSNLRACTTQQNRQNSGPKRGRKYKGVYAHPINGRYKAMIRDCDGFQRHLGWFDTPERAAQAYNEAALREHGEFAVLNEV